MATITVKTTEEEQLKTLEAIKQRQGHTIAMSEISRLSGLSISRVRYAIADLVESNKIRKVPTKAISPKYIRYKYEIV